MVLEHLLSIFSESPLQEHASQLHELIAELDEVSSALTTSRNGQSAAAYLYMLREQLYHLTEVTSSAFSLLGTIEANLQRLSPDVNPGLFEHVIDMDPGDVDQQITGSVGHAAGSAAGPELEMSQVTEAGQELAPFVLTVPKVTLYPGAPKASLYDRLPVIMSQVSSEFVSPADSQLYMHISPGLICQVKLLAPLVQGRQNKRCRFITKEECGQHLKWCSFTHKGERFMKPQVISGRAVTLEEYVKHLSLSEVKHMLASAAHDLLIAALWHQNELRTPIILSDVDIYT